MLSERSETKHLNGINTDSIKDTKNTESTFAKLDASPLLTQKLSMTRNADSIKDASPIASQKGLSHDELSFHKIDSKDSKTSHKRYFAVAQHDELSFHKIDSKDSKTSQNTESKAQETSPDYLNQYSIESKKDSVMLSERSETKHLDSKTDSCHDLALQSKGEVSKNIESINIDSKEKTQITESTFAKLDASPLLTQKLSMTSNADSIIAMTRNADSIKDASPIATLKGLSHDDSSLHKIDFKDSKTSQNIESKALNIPKISYIIFLDSDDYWHNECIESCIKYSKNMDIVWFVYDMFYDGVKDGEKWDTRLFHKLGSGRIDNIEWMERVKKLNLDSFAFIWCGLIDFKYLQSINLKCIDKVSYEDQHFGVSLFIQAQNIYLLDKYLHFYRIRPHSTCTFESDDKITKASIPPYISDIYEAFDNAVMTKAYHSAANFFLTILEFDKFFKNNKNQAINEFIIMQFFPHYINRVLEIFKLKKDPWNLIAQTYKLKPYIDALNAKSKGTIFLNRDMKLAMNFPKLYPILKPLLKPYAKLKRLEQSLRKFVKKKS